MNSVLYLCEGVAAELLHVVFLSVKMDGCGHCCGLTLRSDQTVTQKNRMGEDMRKEDMWERT